MIEQKLSDLVVSETYCVFAFKKRVHCPCIFLNVKKETSFFFTGVQLMKQQPRKHIVILP